MPTPRTAGSRRTLLPLAGKLEWLQNPDAGPRPGYFYPAMNDHPLVICNPRGIYNDHISQHIMMFLLALAQGLPYYVEAQRQRTWKPDARPRPALDLTTATALIHGVGGIGQETARRCAAFGMRGHRGGPALGARGARGRAPQPRRAGRPAAATPTWSSRPRRTRPRRKACGTPRASADEADRRSSSTSGAARRRSLEDLTAALESRRHRRLRPRRLRDRAATVRSSALDAPERAADAAHRRPGRREPPERRYQILLENARRFAAGEPLRNVVDKAAWY